MNQTNLVLTFVHLRNELDKVFQTLISKNSKNIYIKADGTPVSKIDLEFSKIIKKHFKKTKDFSNFTYYSEEEYGELIYPAVIVDPIDGTRELINGVPECAVSIAIMASKIVQDPSSIAYIYNPFTKNEVILKRNYKLRQQKHKDNFRGLVSRSEWQGGLYKESSYHLLPVGSIANKLMELYQGNCEFVITLRNKWIWDIAAGTVLLSSVGIVAYTPKGELKEFKGPLIEGPILWCYPEDYEKLSLEFFLKKT